MADLFQPDAPPPDVVGYALIAPERGVDSGEGFTYAVPATLADLRVGERVTVPLGRRNAPVGGYVLQRTTQAELGELDPRRVKPILSREAHRAALNEDLVELARWIGRYYACPLGMVLQTMMPAAVKRGTGSRSLTLLKLLAEPPAGVKLTKLQRGALDALREAGDWVEVHELAQRAGASSVAPVKRLIEAGLVEQRSDTQAMSREDEAMWGVVELAGAPSVVLNEDQERITREIIGGLGSFAVHLIHGVTGSGKTEVYLRVIEAVLGGGGGAIALVPEIALTAQTIARFRARFPTDQLAVMHSGLTAAQRHREWQRVHSGQASVVVGARSAVFAPLTPCRLILVDEEHDSSYKQDQLPRYHGRDVAIKRAQLLGATVVLGSATPSLESWHNATRPDAPYRLHTLPQRVAGLTLPKVEVVDMREERRKHRGVRLLSDRLGHAMRQTLEQGRQTLLLLNRRGFGNYVACPDHACGYLHTCDHCDVLMVYHLNPGSEADASAVPAGHVRCHHCDTQQVAPRHCPQCGKKITIFGLGTQRVEREVAALLPQARLARMDADSTRGSGDHHRLLERFARGELDILVGTQMIAKGLDLPRVGLVGVVHADTSLHLPDFRSSERSFQLIAQVAGRTGRGTDAGRVVVQTFQPEDPTLASAAQHDFVGFARREMATRVLAGLPPLTRMARIVCRDRDRLKAHERAWAIHEGLRTINAEQHLNVRLREPAVCPIARLADHHRMQVEVIAPSAQTLQRLITAMRNRHGLHADTHVAIDVDPVAML